MNRSTCCLLLLLWISFVSPAVAQRPPSGFTNTNVGSDWVQPIGLTFAKDGRMYVWEKAGKVWMVEKDVKASVPFIDIGAEVGDWRDHGLLGFALDPDFYTNGFIYLLYAVDRHHLMKAGTPEYSATANEYLNATIGRVTRYTANAADGFRTVDLSSRTVLLGKTPSTGIPITGSSHGVGSLAFGSDRTLLVSCGDGGVANGRDTGSAQSSYYKQALTDSIVLPQQNVGAFRAQQVDVLSGKILRIDPATGAGLPSNPFFQPNAPYSPRSRVWALGFRNPFRMTKRPDTGSTNPADGNPGVFYVGDVGWSSREEMDVVNKPGLNFGWPLFEGLEPTADYSNLNRTNPYSPNPLYNTGNCSQAFFSFSDLIREATLDPNVSFANPCDPQQQIPPNIPRFLHARPVFDWLHSTPVTRTGSFVGYSARIDTLGIQSPVAGTAFKGNASISGFWYTGTSFPPEYQNGYFHTDYGAGWIRFFQMDGFDRPIKISRFIDVQANATAMAVHPTSGDLYYVNLSPSTANPLQEVKKVSYTTNRYPVAFAVSDSAYGKAPLTVRFSSAGSSDPEGNPLLYEWDFGDESAPSKEANPTHLYTEPLASPALYTVTLKVTDQQGLTSTAKLNVSVNNTPPAVAITSPSGNSTYPLTMDTTFALRAIASDKEQGAAGLRYAWQVTLHHNNHSHAEPLDTNRSTSATISPVGCDGEDYAYIISLTITDSYGLSASDRVTLLPNCNPMFNVIALKAVKGNAQVTLTWTNPPRSFDEVMIVAKPRKGIRQIPAGDGSSYVADNNFSGTGTLFDRGRVVYKGNASPQTIAGLVNDSLYFFRVFTRVGNDWSVGKEVSATPSLITSNEELPANAISIYPNPAEKAFTLRMKGYPDVKQVRVQLYNQTGQKVIDQLVDHTPDDQAIIGLGRFSKGLYYLQLQLNDEVVVKKLVIQ